MSSSENPLISQFTQKMRIFEETAARFKAEREREDDKFYGYCDDEVKRQN